MEEVKIRQSLPKAYWDILTFNDLEGQVTSSAVSNLNNWKAYSASMLTFGDLLSLVALENEGEFQQ